jgi:hypothetical protein
MTALPAHLAGIVADVRDAAVRDLERRRRRRHRARIGALATALLALTVGIAGAATGFDYFGLVRAADPGATVTDLGDGRLRVVASLAGARADAVVTDLGVTESSRRVPGAEVCDWDEAAGLLGCSGAGGSSGGPASTLIPAGTHVYRVEPTASPAEPVEPTVLYVPELALELRVEPAASGG